LLETEYLPRVKKTPTTKEDEKFYSFFLWILPLSSLPILGEIHSGVPYKWQASQHFQ